MGSRPLTRRTIIGSLLAPVSAVGASGAELREAVKAMEESQGLTIFTGRDAIFHHWHYARIPKAGMAVWPAISPDASALCWGAESDSLEDGPFLTVNSLMNGVRTVLLEGQFGGAYAVSSRGDIVVATALLRKGAGPTKLLMIDFRSGLRIEDFTSKLPLRGPASISGAGDLVAFDFGGLQVFEIPGGKSVYQGPGRYPRLSPDGKRLAFIKEERLYIRSLEDESTKEFLPGKQTMGIGGWSPDGRYLLAGSWTRPKLLALQKRLVAVDTTSGDYAELGTIGDGDFGLNLRWVSVDLMAAPAANKQAE